MSRMRAAPLPSVSAFASARALATFYQGIGSAQLLPPELVDDLQRIDELSVRRSSPAAAAAEGVRYAAGFQLADCTDASGRTVGVIGHGAPGGTLGLCVPGSGVALAVTVSKLSPGRVATCKIVEAVLGEFGLTLGKSAGLLRDG